MSSNSSIYYFLIANHNTRKEIGSYVDNSDTANTISDFNFIISESKKILHSNDESLNQNKKNKVCLKNHNIYYTITPAGTFYLAAVRKDSDFCDEENLIFELFEDIDNQGIRKLIDKNGELTNVGRQNLKFSISQYQDNNKLKFKSKNNLVLFDLFPSEENSKISTINTQINEITNTMKENVKNLVSNVNEMEDLETKSSRIKDSSLKFQQDALALERKTKWQKYKTKILIGIAIATIIIGFILFFIFK